MALAKFQDSAGVTSRLVTQCAGRLLSIATVESITKPRNVIIWVGINPKGVLHDKFQIRVHHKGF